MKILSPRVRLARRPSWLMRFRHCTAALAILMATASAEEEGFTPMFNGRDLSGWVNVNGAPETWTVRDGLIACTGRPTGALRTERQYENFIMEVEWRHLKNAGNAGIFIWASPLAAPGVRFLRAIEVQVLDHGYGNTAAHTTHGDVFAIHGATMKPFGRHSGMRSFPSESRSKPSPEWNHYRIVCEAGVIRLHVNGKEVSGGEACVWRKGYIGLESEGSPTEWRNLRIKELPASGATAEQTAPVAQGHRPLYNGADLRGWNSKTPDRWKPNDWQLALTDGPASEPLWTDAEFGDCELIFDCRASAKRGADTPLPVVLLRGAATTATLPLGGLKPGQWSRFTITIKGGECTVQPEGREAVRVPLEGAVGKRALGLGGAGANFANIYLRALD